MKEVRPAVADEDFRLEIMPLECDGHAERVAAAVPRSHEDRGRLAPKPELECRVRLHRPPGPRHRHHHACRAAGEIGGLVEVRRCARRAGARERGASGSATRRRRPRSSARGARSGDSPRRRKALRPRGCCRALRAASPCSRASRAASSAAASSAEAMPRRPNCGATAIEYSRATEAAGLEQHERVAGECAAGLGDDDGGRRAADQPAKTARREPVGGEDAVLDREQRRNVLGARGPHRDCGGGSRGRCRIHLRRPGHETGIVETADLGAAQAEYAREHLVGVLAEFWRTRRRSRARCP